MREGAGFSPILLHGHYTQARATGFLLAAPDHHQVTGPTACPKAERGSRKLPIRLTLGGTFWTPLSRSWDDLPSARRQTQAQGGLLYAGSGVELLEYR